MLEGNRGLQLLLRQVVPVFHVDLKVSLDFERIRTDRARIVGCQFGVFFVEVSFCIRQFRHRFLAGEASESAVVHLNKFWLQI